MDPHLLIFSGYNFRAVVAFCRFARDSGIPVSIVARNDKDPVFDTDFGDWVFHTRTSEILNLDQIVGVVERLKEIEKVDGLVILPSTEYLNRVLIKHRESLVSSGIRVPLCDSSLYEQLSNKKTFSDLCQGAGLDVPRELDPDGDLEFPLVIKPRNYFGPDGEVQFKPILVDDVEMLHKVQQTQKLDDCYYQEYVKGDSYYLLYHIAKNGDVAAFSQRNLIQQADGGSIIAARGDTLHKDAIAGVYSDLLKSLGFHGLIMIELRRSGDRMVMIEANPRLWGPSQLALDAGMPLFSRLVNDWGGGLPDPAPASAPVSYFWLQGLLEDLGAERKPVWHGYSPEEFAVEFHDWLPIDLFYREDTVQHYLRIQV